MFFPMLITFPCKDFTMSYTILPWRYPAQCCSTVLWCKFYLTCRVRMTCSMYSTYDHLQLHDTVLLCCISLEITFWEHSNDATYLIVWLCITNNAIPCVSYILSAHSRTSFLWAESIKPAGGIAEFLNFSRTYNIVSYIVGKLSKFPLRWYATWLYDCGVVRHVAECLYGTSRV